MRSKLEALQGLRAAGALLVVANHAIEVTVAQGTRSAAAMSFAFFLGDFGVKIFFTISGFVMVVAHGTDFGQTGAPAKFLVKRLTRIVPLYWLATALNTIRLAAHGKRIDAVKLLCSFLFLPHRDAAGDWNPVYVPGWTLNYEMFFYVVFALGLLLSFRNGILAIAAGLSLLVLGCLVLTGGESTPTNAVAYLARPIVLFFIGGIGLGLIHLRLAARGWLPEIGRNVRLLAAALVGCAVSFFVFWNGLTAASLAVEAGGCIAMVAICVMAEDDTPPRFMGAAAVRLGDASYSIYLMHIFILGPLGWALMRLHLDSPAAFVVAALTGASVVGLLTYRYIEQPLMRRLKPGART
jgi:exopolysaccharide production protein ExoZ